MCRVKLPTVNSPLPLLDDACQVRQLFEFGKAQLGSRVWKCFSQLKDDLLVNDGVCHSVKCGHGHGVSGSVSGGSADGERLIDEVVDRRHDVAL